MMETPDIWKEYSTSIYNSKMKRNNAVNHQPAPSSELTKLFDKLSTHHQEYIMNEIYNCLNENEYATNRQHAGCFLDVVNADDIDSRLNGGYYNDSDLIADAVEYFGNDWVKQRFGIDSKATMAIQIADMDIRRKLLRYVMAFQKFKTQNEKFPEVNDLRTLKYYIDLGLPIPKCESESDLNRGPVFIIIDKDAPDYTPYDQTGFCYIHTHYAYQMAWLCEKILTISLNTLDFGAYKLTEILIKTINFAEKHNLPLRTRCAMILEETIKEEDKFLREKEKHLNND